MNNNASYNSMELKRKGINQKGRNSYYSGNVNYEIVVMLKVTIAANGNLCGRIRLYARCPQVTKRCGYVICGP